MRPRTFKTKGQRIAEAHLASSERGARLLAAAGGDVEHAARIDRVLEDLNANSRPPAPVIRLPRPYDQAFECTVDESAGLAELEPEPPLGWHAALVWLALVVAGWAIVAGLVAAAVLIVEALT